nr:DNA ligase 1-like isoform X1 [Ipomoea batatas]
MLINHNSKPILKTAAYGEDVVVKLMEFLEAPHATTAELLAEKEQSSKGKRKRTSNKSGSSASGSSKGSAKSIEPYDPARNQGAGFVAFSNSDEATRAVGLLVRSPILCALGSTNHIDEDFFVIDGDDVVNLGDDSDERFEGNNGGSMNGHVGDEYTHVAVYRFKFA